MTKNEKAVDSKFLLEGLSQTEDISGAILYLASDMAKFVIGETIKVDGGWTAILRSRKETAQF